MVTSTFSFLLFFLNHTVGLTMKLGHPQSCPMKFIELILSFHLLSFGPLLTFCSFVSMSSLPSQVSFCGLIFSHSHQHLNKPSLFLPWNCGVLMKIAIHSEICGFLIVIPVTYTSLCLTTACLHVSSTWEPPTSTLFIFLVSASLLRASQPPGCLLIALAWSARGHIHSSLSSANYITLCVRVFTQHHMRISSIFQK